MAEFTVVKEVTLGARKAKFGDGENELRSQVWEVGDPPRRGIGIREWWRNDAGEWCPSKSGVSIRPGELAALAELLRVAIGGDDPSGTPPAQQSAAMDTRRMPPADDSGWRQIGSSRYAGRCAMCGSQYEERATVAFHPEGPPGAKAAHWACLERERFGADSAEPEKPDPTADWARPVPPPQPDGARVEEIF